MTDSCSEHHFVTGSDGDLSQTPVTQVCSSHRDFERIHNEHLSRLAGVARLRSNFAIRTVYRTTRYLL